MTGSRSACWFLVLLAVVMVLGHICASPFHAHAGALATHEPHDSHHGAGHAGDGEAHVGSCDVLQSAPAGDAAPVAVPIAAVAAVVWPATRPLVAEDVSVVVGSPPLFLLHSVLLI